MWVKKILSTIIDSVTPFDWSIDWSEWKRDRPSLSVVHASFECRWDRDNSIYVNDVQLCLLGAAKADCDQLQSAGMVPARNDQELSREKSQDKDSCTNG